MRVQDLQNLSWRASMADDEGVPWEGRCIEAAWAFARQRANLSASNPYAENALQRIINDLMTELWDNGFSQSEIRTAFEKALLDMPRYAAGEERRGDKTEL
jgi:hypothetical protein